MILSVFFSILITMGSAKKQRNLIDDILITLLYASVIPSILVFLYLLNVIVLNTLKLSLVAFFIIFVIGPLIFKYSYTIQRSFVFLNFANWPKNPDYSDPSKYGIDGVLNYYVQTDENVRLGVWQVLPENLLNSNIPYNEESFHRVLNNSQNVILYNHGNAGSRLAPHRVELYKILRKYFHVIAFDYRSYADSTNVAPTEIGLVNDSKYMYEWIRNRTCSKIFVWGHSLGTAISTHMLSLLANKDIHPAGLFLESPFNNMRDEIELHTYAKWFRNLPWFQYTIVEPMQENNFVFSSDQYILNVNCPILILHAEDDTVVPYKLGHKLYHTAQEARRDSQGDVQFRTFEGKYSYGHRYICRAPNLDSIIQSFIMHSIAQWKTKLDSSRKC